MIFIKNQITEYVRYDACIVWIFWGGFLLNIFMLTYMFTGHHMLQSQSSQTTTTKNRNVIAVRTWLWNPSKPPPTNKLWSSGADSLPQTPTAVLYQVITADRWSTWPISHPLTVGEECTGKDRRRLRNCALILSIFRWKWFIACCCWKEICFVSLFNRLMC